MLTQISVVSAAGFETPAAQQYMIDSKAMRKVGNNKNVAMVVSNADAGSGSLIAVEGRMLLKLH